jgi:hypothetical protein
MHKMNPFHNTFYYLYTSFVHFKTMHVKSPLYHLRVKALSTTNCVDFALWMLQSEKIYDSVTCDE